ncbi:MAG TPA: 30S ribosomal protein S17 [Bryobacteraceae bacterium]|nr:30S ribosomal protein S17 [Bryobacteraceae bacterium]
MAEQANVSKNEKVGEVVSTKMQKTIVVEVIRRVPHPLYKRIVTRRKKFYAHDEEQTAKTGDVVRIIEHRPLSRLKRWALAEVVRRAVQVGVDPSQIDAGGVAGNVSRRPQAGKGKGKGRRKAESGKGRK